MVDLRTLFFLLLAFSVNAAEPVKLRTIAQGNFSGIQEAAQLVVTNTAQWTEIWAKHSAQRTTKEEPPAIDFEKESVLFVALGRKSSGGYKIEIFDMRQSDSKLEVLVKVRTPRPGGLSLQALTAPFHAVAVPKIKVPVQFRTEQVQPEAR